MTCNFLPYNDLYLGIVKILAHRMGSCHADRDRKGELRDED